VRTSSRLRLAAACALSGLAALVATAPADASRADCTPEAGWPAQNADLALQVVGLVNQHRASLGLAQVQISQTLTNAAAWKASQLAYDVATSGGAAFAHNDFLTNRTPVARLQACGWAGNFGENIALGQATPDAVTQAWLASTEATARTSRTRRGAPSALAPHPAALPARDGCRSSATPCRIPSPRRRRA